MFEEKGIEKMTFGFIQNKNSKQVLHDWTTNVLYFVPYERVKII